MSGGLFSTKNFSVKFHKVNWSTFVNSLSMENSTLFPLTEANIMSENININIVISEQKLKCSTIVYINKLHTLVEQ